MTDSRQQLFSDKEEEGFNLRDFIFTYVLRFWYLYVLFIGGALAWAWLKIRYTTPVYQVNSTILIKDEESKGGGISEESIFQDLGLMQGGIEVQNEIEILRSRPIMEAVISQLGMDVEYYTLGRVRTSEAYPAHVIKATLHDVSPLGYDVTFGITVRDSQHFTLTLHEQKTERQFGQMIEIPEGKFIFTLINKDDLPQDDYSVVFREPHKVAPAYVGGLSITPIESRSSVLNLSYQHPVPQKGIDILNAVVEEYNQVTIEDKNKVGKNTVQFIDDRLKYLTTELSDVEGDLEQYKKSNDIPTEISSSVDNLIIQLNEYDKELGELEVQKIILDGLQQYLQNQLTKYEPAPIDLLPSNVSLATLISRYNDLLLERNRLLKNATPDNPVVQNLTVQIDQMRSSMLETIRNINREFDLSLAKARSKNNLFQSKIRTVPTKERGLIEIKRQQGIKEALFLYLLQKREETALSLAVAIPNSRVVNPPIRTGGPISPNTRSIYLTAFMIGLLIPSLFIYLKYLLTNTIQSESDITQITSTPLLASIGQQKNSDPIVVKKNSRSAVAEMFRLLRTNLQFLGAGKNNQVILVTSTVSGEGKSFITLNLGITLALADKKTIILELDLRKPKLIRYLTQKPPESGISNYLIGKLSFDQLIRQSDVHPNLSYISSGPIPPNPAELLLTEPLTDMIEQLKQTYDYILLDTPPVGMVADALLLGKLADSALYVVRQGHTYKGSLNYIQEIYQENKLPNLAIIYNGVTANDGYGYGQKYGYGYGYGYYDDAALPKKWWQIWKRR